MNSKKFKSTRNLEFRSEPYQNPLMIDQFNEFRIGTCKGLYKVDKKGYYILAVYNERPGNGHFEDTLEWFEHLCKLNKVDLYILEVANDKLKSKLVEKHQFISIGTTCYKKIEKI